MENRFGIKDFFLFALVAAVLVAVIVSMVQYDRQWRVVQDIREGNARLADDLNRLQRRIDSGVAVRGGGGGGTEDGGGAAGENDPFFQIERAERQPDFARGGWYIDNFGTKIGRLTPLVSSDVYQTWIEYLVLESLAQRDPYSLEFVPHLATGWTASEDGLTYAFMLRDGVRFSDGTPLTADDVVFTFDWIRNPEVQADRSRSYLDKLKAVTKIDDRTIEFAFGEPYFLNFEAIALQPILSKAYYGRFSPIDYNESISLLFGSGPYVLEAGEGWSTEQPVTLARNPRYWGVPPTFEKMVFQQIEEDAAQSVMFRNGELDVFRTAPEQFEQLKDDPAIAAMSDAYAYDSPFGGYTYIGWNQEKRVGGEAQQTIFADARVRRAMTMLVDRQRLADEIYYGHAGVASGPFAPTGPQADPDIEPWPYDPQAALSLLAEAGWEDRDGDGVLEDASGRQFRFGLMYPGGSDTSEKIALFLKDSFAAGKILMQPDRQDWPVLVDRLNKSDFEAATLGWSSSPETDPYQIFSSTQAKTGGDNRTGYRSDRLDAAIEDARTTIDAGERYPKWHEVHRILHEDQPYTFLLNRKALRLFNDRIKNVEETKLGLNYEFLNAGGGVMPWYIPEARQTR